MDHSQDLACQVARDIDVGLRQELGQGIDVPRMVAIPLYARDVLLVCEGLQTPALLELAQRFRASINGADATQVRTTPPVDPPVRQAVAASVNTSPARDPQHVGLPLRWALG